MPVYPLPVCFVVFVSLGVFFYFFFARAYLTTHYIRMEGGGEERVVPDEDYLAMVFQDAVNERERRVLENKEQGFRDLEQRYSTLGADEGEFLYRGLKSGIVHVLLRAKSRIPFREEERHIHDAISEQLLLIDDLSKRAGAIASSIEEIKGGEPEKGLSIIGDLMNLPFAEEVARELTSLAEERPDDVEDVRDYFLWNLSERVLSSPKGVVDILDKMELAAKRFQGGALKELLSITKSVRKTQEYILHDMDEEWLSLCTHLYERISDFEEGKQEPPHPQYDMKKGSAIKEWIGGLLGMAWRTTKVTGSVAKATFKAIVPKKIRKEAKKAEIPGPPPGKGDPNAIYGHLENLQLHGVQKSIIGQLFDEIEWDKKEKSRKATIEGNRDPFGLEELFGRADMEIANLKLEEKKTILAAIAQYTGDMGRAALWTGSMTAKTLLTASSALYAMNVMASLLDDYNRIGFLVIGGLGIYGANWALNRLNKELGVYEKTHGMVDRKKQKEIEHHMEQKLPGIFGDKNSPIARHILDSKNYKAYITKATIVNNNIDKVATEYLKGVNGSFGDVLKDWEKKSDTWGKFGPERVFELSNEVKDMSLRKKSLESAAAKIQELKRKIAGDVELKNIEASDWEKTPPTLQDVTMKSLESKGGGNSQYEGLIDNLARALDVVKFDQPWHSMNKELFLQLQGDEASAKIGKLQDALGLKKNPQNALVEDFKNDEEYRGKLGALLKDVKALIKNPGNIVLAGSVRRTWEQLLGVGTESDDADKKEKYTNDAKAIEAYLSGHSFQLERKTKATDAVGAIAVLDRMIGQLGRLKDEYTKGLVKRTEEIEKKREAREANKAKFSSAIEKKKALIESAINESKPLKDFYESDLSSHQRDDVLAGDFSAFDVLLEEHAKGVNERSKELDELRLDYSAVSGSVYSLLKGTGEEEPGEGIGERRIGRYQKLLDSKFPMLTEEQFFMLHKSSKLRTNLFSLEGIGAAGTDIIHNVLGVGSWSGAIARSALAILQVGVATAEVYGTFWAPGVMKKEMFYSFISAISGGKFKMQDESISHERTQLMRNKLKRRLDEELARHKSSKNKEKIGKIASLKKKIARNQKAQERLKQKLVASEKSSAPRKNFIQWNRADYAVELGVKDEELQKLAAELQGVLDQKYQVPDPEDLIPGYKKKMEEFAPSRTFMVLDTIAKSFVWSDTIMSRIAMYSYLSRPLPEAAENGYIIRTLAGGVKSVNSFFGNLFDSSLTQGPYIWDVSDREAYAFMPPDKDIDTPWNSLYGYEAPKGLGWRLPRNATADTEYLFKQMQDASAVSGKGYVFSGFRELRNVTDPAYLSRAVMNTADSVLRYHTSSSRGSGFMDLGFQRPGTGEYFQGTYFHTPSGLMPRANMVDLVPNRLPVGGYSPVENTPIPMLAVAAKVMSEKLPYTTKLAVQRDSGLFYRAHENFMRVGGIDQLKTDAEQQLVEAILAIQRSTEGLMMAVFRETESGAQQSLENLNLAVFDAFKGFYGHESLECPVDRSLSVNALFNAFKFVLDGLPNASNPLTLASRASRLMDEAVQGVVSGSIINEMNTQIERTTEGIMGLYSRDAVMGLIKSIIEIGFTELGASSVTHSSVGKIRSEYTRAIIAQFLRVFPYDVIPGVAEAVGVGGLGAVAGVFKNVWFHMFSETIPTYDEMFHSDKETFREVFDESLADIATPNTAAMFMTLAKNDPTGTLTTLYAITKSAIFGLALTFWGVRYTMKIPSLMMESVKTSVSSGISEGLQKVNYFSSGK